MDSKDFVDLQPTSQKLGPVLALSVIVAFLSAEATLGVRNRAGAVVLGLLLFLVWIGLVIYAVRKFRKRGFWLLLGSPFVLVVPLVWLFFLNSK